MDSLKHLRIKISTEAEAESVENDYYFYVLAVEFPDDDKIVYVKSDSPLFKDCLMKFDNEHDARAYAIEQFPGLIYQIEKMK